MNYLHRFIRYIEGVEHDLINCKASRYPFVNLIPRLEDSKLIMQHKIRQLGKYMNIVKPVVTNSFSRKANSVTLSNFVHDISLDPTTWDPPANYNTIMISHSDPGVDKISLEVLNVID
jgi:hypothetical protein